MILQMDIKYKKHLGWIVNKPPAPNRVKFKISNHHQIYESIRLKIINFKISLIPTLVN